MGFRGIKNRIFVQFWILFFLSMLFIDFLVVFILLESSISRFIEQKKFSLTVACENQQRYHLAERKSWPVNERMAFPKGDRFFFAEKTGIPRSKRDPNNKGHDLNAAVYQTLNTGESTTRRAGKTIGLFFLQHKSVIITYPVKIKGRVVAAGGIESPLTLIYHDFRRIQKNAFIFVVINSFFFALFGNHQLSRIYFRPLKRLAKRAESYQDEEPLFFAVRKEDNEFSVLSSSLNKMLHRIADDKHVLKETIGFLEAANADLKKAQNDVIRAEKLATVGRLTSGIAHEIGNPIGIVLGYLDLLKQTDLTSLERNDFIDRSEKEITRVNHIIRQLLDMSRASGGESKTISIHQLLNDLISVFDFQPTANNIAFDSKLGATHDFVLADPDQLRQVFLNILLNAVDAVNSIPSDDGRIILTTQRASGNLNASVDPEGTFLMVTITDNGPGIDSSNLEHIFDPFFTTKETGKGTGLGLSVSFMIVEKLGGHLSASNIDDNGAIFEVLLPLAERCEENGNPGTETQTGSYG